MMAKQKFSEEDILLILLQHHGGIKTQVLCRKYGITPESLNEWMEKYGSVNKDDLQAAKANDMDCQKLKNFLSLLNRVYQKNN
jgi:putative transposase